MSEPELISRKRAAGRLGVSVRTLDRYLNDPDIALTRVTGRGVFPIEQRQVWVSVAEVTAFLAGALPVA